jgi:2-dehydro-3-deoxy-D-arabinonate dehydratase
MKIARVEWVSKQVEVGILDGDRLNLTGFETPLDLLVSPDMPSADEYLSWPQLLAGTYPKARLLAPIDPPEVWAYGFTYERGPQFSQSPVIPRGPAYTAAIEAGRPEIFFKTTGFRVVGPNDNIGIRGDSCYTAVEAELCLILDGEGRPVLFTAGNDVSAWDIERQNPLWLAQSKTYKACCALGPVAVTRDELPDNARITCQVVRNEKEIFSGSITIDKMHWSFEELVHYAAAFNPLPTGTVLMTGTAIIRPDAESLAEGDITHITIDGIGTLTNVGSKIGSLVPFEQYSFIKR